MTVQEAYRQLTTQLSNIYDTREAASIAALIMEHITGFTNTERLIKKHIALTPEQESLLAVYTQQLLQHKPLQYVLREAWFAGLKFYVDENVLIPRPETEELVEWIAGCGLQIADCAMLDIGTGSGCIPVSLKKKFIRWHIRAVDISAGALNVAKKNASLNYTDIEFTLLNILDETAWQQLPMFNIIVSNPPYIKQSEASTMLDNVLAFEPHTALFVPDDDALLFYRKIAAFALQHLQKGGLLFFEINESLGADVWALLGDMGFSNIELRTDLQGKDRMVKAVKQ